MQDVMRWTVVLDIRHVDSRTAAAAHLHQRDSDLLTGHGTVYGEYGPERAAHVSDALAAAHALDDLAMQLRRAVAEAGR